MSTSGAALDYATRPAPKDNLTRPSAVLWCCKMSLFYRFATSGLSMTIHRGVAAVAKMPSARTNMSCYALIERAEKLVLADLGQPLHISALCRALAVSERTLRNVFHRTYGVPPCRHLRMLRLSQARRSLLSADGKSVTVTEIATSFGFVELGRFSVEYRKAFGESPSQTLQRTSPDTPLAIGGSNRRGDLRLVV
jgi:transcriptional regulator GlxA family with amidase domain